MKATHTPITALRIPADLKAAAQVKAAGEERTLTDVIVSALRAYVAAPVDQSEWPAHLRDDAPRQQCSTCQRWTWATSEFGQICGMPQPNGSLCAGTFR